MSAPMIVPASAMPARRRRVQRQTLMVDNHRWPIILYGASAATVVTYPLVQSLSPWFCVAVFVMSLIIGHLFAVIHRLPWLPGVVLLVSGLQWLLVPAIAYSLPALPVVVPAAVSSDVYFSFAVPGFIAFAVGLFLPIVALKNATAGDDLLARMSPIQRDRLVAACKQLAIAGVLARVISYGGVPGSVRFAVDILARLTLVGSVSLMLLRARGWPLWIAGAIAMELINSLLAGLFIGLFLQAIHIGILVAFRFRVPIRRIAQLSAASLVVLLAVNGFKGAYRLAIGDLDAQERIGLGTQQFWAILTDPQRLFSPENIAFNLARLNQGSITARVLYWTPQFEPFAHGETVSTAIRAAVLPRALDPTKAGAGGADNYPRFTGLQLLHGTSINLSALGEFYANYGKSGAWLAMLVWGLFLSSIFRAFCRRARTALVWWAWVPFVMPSVLSAESGLVDLLNEIFKSGVVMLAIIVAMPAWRSLLAAGRRAARRPAS